MVNVRHCSDRPTPNCAWDGPKRQTEKRCCSHSDFDGKWWCAQVIAEHASEMVHSSVRNLIAPITTRSNCKGSPTEGPGGTER